MIIHLPISVCWALLRDEGIDAQIVGAHNEIEILRGPAEKKYKKKYNRKGSETEQKKEYFSIIAFSSEVTGIDEEGFSYPLHQATLYNKESIGVSNEIVEKEATLRLQSGYLIVMRTTD